ncbi:MAG TPA: EF-P lysine aminoacylase GenX [Planctomycetaceae bacterium]|nr:EF-P lysine aminoacylase GenX [Planctomycetaceae bacterium]
MADDSSRTQPKQPCVQWASTASVETLTARGQLVWRLRRFFNEHNFIEVHTPTICRHTVVDRHIEPVWLSAENLGLSAETAGPARKDSSWFLQTSPEFAMKRLVASGMQAIYQIGPAYRATEVGHKHNIEFTMLEWYRVGDDQAAGIQLLGEVIDAAVDCGQPNVTTYREVFTQKTGLDPVIATATELSAFAGGNLDVDSDWTAEKDEWLNLIFSQLIEPTLGIGRPTVISNYPVNQAALARVSDEDSETAERFELFWNGVELANGYCELTDASELESRNRRVNAQRIEDGHRPLPEDSFLLDAMRAGLPACSGCAVGIDRLVMAALGQDTIDQVMPFPIQRA